MNRDAIDHNGDLDAHLRRVNSRYTDETPPTPRTDRIELSGEEAVELACILAEYSHNVRAEYGTDSVGGWYWTRELLHRAGVVEEHQ